MKCFLIFASNGLQGATSGIKETSGLTEWKIGHIFPIVQIPGQQFNLLGGQRFNGQVCNRLGQRFAAVVLS